jgi:hypothetical protein
MTGTLIALGALAGLVAVALTVVWWCSPPAAIDVGKISDAWRDEHFGNRRDE